MSETIFISLVVFDCDDTLWESDRRSYISGTIFPELDRDDYSFHPLGPLQIKRDDGQIFRLYPEVKNVLQELDSRGVLLSLASYNHQKPLISALEAFGIYQFFRHSQIEWNFRKDKMLKNILRKFTQDGFLVSPQTSLFIDDDYRGIYRGQMASLGVHFLQKNIDLYKFSELLNHPRFNFIPPQRSLL